MKPPACLVEDPATGLHRPRDYMQSLETRVAYLEGLLRKSRPDVAVDHLSKDRNTEKSGEREASGEPRPTTTSPQSGNLVDDSSYSVLIEADQVGTDLASDVAFLALSASGREPQYFGPSSALSFSRIASSTLGLHRRQEGSRIGAIETRPVHAPGDRKPVICPLPPVCEKLCQAYFENVHPQYPFLHRPTFDVWKAECMQAQREGVLEQMNKERMFFVLMVRTLLLPVTWFWLI
jgi:hypothetical protein